MDPLKTIEIKAFVPARDFALSRRFYTEIGFEEKSQSDGVAYFAHGDCSFLLQDVYHRERAEHLVMHLLVSDVDAWYRALLALELPGRYGAPLDAPADRPWGMRDFFLHDPSGVRWRIAQNIR